jgi:hypothetical protein
LLMRTGTDDLMSAFSVRTTGEAGAILEVEMTTVKALAIVALLAGGTSLAVAQNGPATGGQPPVAGGAAGNPAAPGPQVGGKSHRATAHHKKMHMSAKGQPHKKMYMSAKPHKGSKLTPASNAKPQTKQ